MSEIVDGAGVYAGIPDHEYHSDRKSLSSSGARKLLPPSCPALFKHEQDNPRPHQKHFDVGHAAHALVLGYGAPIVEIPDSVLASNGATSTKAAKEFIAEQRAAGNTPLKPDDFATVHAMTDALKTHPLAPTLFGAGAPELSYYWDDPGTGVTLRARLDWTPEPIRGRRMVVADYKTTVDSNPTKFGKSAADYGYYMQAPWYLDGLEALGVSDDAAFVFVTQSKTAPYLVSVVELDHEAMELGGRMNRRAIEMYSDCMEAGVWPGWGDDVHYVSLPNWIHYQNEEFLNV